MDYIENNVLSTDSQVMKVKSFEKPFIFTFVMPDLIRHLIDLKETSYQIPALRPE
jgi:hypothetical protein